MRRSKSARVTPRLRPTYKFRAGVGLGDEPHFGFRIAAQFRRLVGGRVNLERKFVLRVEQFDQQGKTPGFELRVAEQVGAVILHEPVQIFSRERAVGNDAGVAGAVADFPRFADGPYRLGSVLP